LFVEIHNLKHRQNAILIKFKLNFSRKVIPFHPKATLQIQAQTYNHNKRLPIYINNSLQTLTTIKCNTNKFLPSGSNNGTTPSPHTPSLSSADPHISIRCKYIHTLSLMPGYGTKCVTVVFSVSWIIVCCCLLFIVIYRKRQRRCM
jgi:hypothetical protein